MSLGWAMENGLMRFMIRWIAELTSNVGFASPLEADFSLLTIIYLHTLLFVFGVNKKTGVDFQF